MILAHTHSNTFFGISFWQKNEEKNHNTNFCNELTRINTLVHSKWNKKTMQKNVSSNDKFIVWTHEIYFLIKAIVSYDENPMDRTDTHTHTSYDHRFGRFLVRCLCCWDCWVAHSMEWKIKNHHLAGFNTKTRGERAKDGEANRKIHAQDHCICSYIWYTKAISSLLMRTHACAFICILEWTSTSIRSFDHTF